MITLLPLIPFVAAFLILLIPAQKEFLIKAISVIAATLCLGIIFSVCAHFDYKSGAYQLLKSWDLFPEMGIRYQVGFDGINLTLALLNAIVAFAGVLVACREQNRTKEYLFFFLILAGAMFGVFTSLNVFFIYVFYEMTLIPIFAMLGLRGKPENKEGAVIRFALYMTAGAIIGLLGLLGLYHLLGPDFLDLTRVTHAFMTKKSIIAPETQNYLAAALIIGFGVMSSLWPFHGWSPRAYNSAPASLSMLHAGVKIGPYILIRVAIAFLPQGFQYWAPTLATLAIIGLIYGAYVAIRQKNLRTMTAFSGISHMGYILLALAAMTPVSLSASVMLIFAHGIMTACLFALIGHLESESGSDAIDAFGGLGKTAPFFAVALMLTGMASAGIPGFANFPAELLVFIGSWKAFPIQTALGVFGVLLTAIYIIRAVQAVCFGEASALSASVKDIGWTAKIPFLVLLAFLIFFGIHPSCLLDTVRPVFEALL